jgi:hypothetical protein
MRIGMHPEEKKRERSKRYIRRVELRREAKHRSGRKLARGM